MDKKEIIQLSEDIANAYGKLGIDKDAKILEKKREESQDPDFWLDSDTASGVMQEISKLEAKISEWTSLRDESKDLVELIEMGDASLVGDIESQYKQITDKFEEKKIELAFNGPYDESDVYLEIFAGAGGTDAQDWTQMLLRMYLRWAEKNKIKAVVVEESSGEEAGLKSVRVELSGGDYLFGKLKGEAGVHRLVRLSPFNSDNLRQTSFAKVDILPKIDKPGDLIIDEKDLKIDVYRAGGHGGQSVNTTDSAVRVTHLPTNIVVSIQNERSQIQNKETAMSILRSKLATLKLQQHKENLAEIKGPNQSAEWGNQIRNYVLHTYNMVKDLRTNYETSDTNRVLDGDIDDFITAYINHTLK